MTTARKHKRLRYLGVRLTDPEAEALEIVAAWMGISTSDVARRALALYTQAAAATPPTPYPYRRPSADARMAALVAAMRAANDR